MKTISFLFTVASFLLIFVACDNEDDTQTDDNQIIGTWNLTRITGGITGKGYPANFTDVEFRSNGTYRINNQDEAKGLGNYTLTRDSNEVALKLVSSDSVKIMFEEYTKTVTFGKEKLVLSDPCCDLFVYEFTKDSN